jgi:hypothetical protein
MYDAVRRDAPPAADAMRKDLLEISCFFIKPPGGCDLLYVDIYI